MLQLADTLRRFEKTKVAVIGDVMLDRYIIGNVSRISPEAPIPVVEVKNGFNTPGGAGNTAANIKSLGGDVKLVGVIGKDYNGKLLKSILVKSGISVKGLVESPLRITTCKDRIVAHKQQLLRLDHEDSSYISKSIEAQFAKIAGSMIRESDIVVVSDYAKGVITKDLMPYFISLAHSAHKLLIVDPRPQNKPFYKNCDFITPNLSEARAMVGNIDDYKDLGKRLMRELNSNVLLTKGEHGMSLFTRKDSKTFLWEDFDVLSKDVYDVTGAGDTVVAAFALSLASGASYREAAMIANYAAGIVVSKFGSATTTRDELLKVMINYNKNSSKT